MKKVILVGDGMGDYPVDSLGGKTPLQAAHAPNMRKIACGGQISMVQTVPEGMPPGSDVANLGLLGYDAAENYTGRAPIEAAGAGIPMAESDVALRCNLVTVTDGVMDDYSAGHITTEEAHALIDTLSAELGSSLLKFHGGVSYRHLLLWSDGMTDYTTLPPHEISGREVAEYLPSGEGSEFLREWMARSETILKDHPVNIARIREGKNPATQIWLWGQGKALTIETYKNLYQLSGGIVSAVDLVRGLGLLAGLEAPVILGATGFVDTNYEGKLEAGKDILSRHDFLYLHIEAPDECGHMGDAALKTQAIEAFDEKIVGPMWCHLESLEEPYQLMVCMDHRTPVSLKGHTSEPVPIAVIAGPSGPVEEESDFDEFVNDGEANAVSHSLVQDFLLKR